MEFAGKGRLVIALVVLAGLALLAWRTMEPGRFQQVVWLLLGFFAVRAVLGHLRSRRIADEASVVRDRQDV